MWSKISLPSPCEHIPVTLWVHDTRAVVRTLRVRLVERIRHLRVIPHDRPPLQYGPML